MDVPNLGQVGIGTLIGIAITQGVAALGHIINQRTSLQTNQIDDRSKLTHDLMEQLENSFNKQGALSSALTGCQHENITLISILANAEAEHRTMHGIMSEILRELDEKTPTNKENLARLCRQQVRCMGRINILYEEARSSGIARIVKAGPRENLLEMDKEDGKKTE
jgi:hypothetical protein